MPVLFLTGASGALATAIRDHFLHEGWNVAGFDRNADSFQHDHYRSYKISAIDEVSVRDGFAAAARELGTPRALIATIGGIAHWKSVAETELSDWNKLLDLNLTSFFLTAKHAVRLMSGDGSIISIGAEHALSPSANKGGYAATKSAVITLTRVLAEEGKLTGINANCVVPFTIHTKANEDWGSAEEIPRWTDPADIAAMCAFLASAPGHAVNGAVIRMPNKM